MKRHVPLLILPLALAACGTPPTSTNDTDATITSAGATESGNAAVPGPGAPPPPMAGTNVADPAPAATGGTQSRYIGRWKGVEGMFLDVAAKPGGGVTMTMQYDLDHKATVGGSVTAEGLRFTRGGESLTAVPSDGDATGLKWLAGKKDCLTVKPGEGYCRD